MAQLYPVDSGLKVPILIAHGTADTTVDPDVIKQLVDKLCKNGETVRLLLLPGVGHLKTGHDAAPDVLKWINDRFAGKPRPSSSQAPACFGSPRVLLSGGQTAVLP